MSTSRRTFLITTGVAAAGTAAAAGAAPAVAATAPSATAPQDHPDGSAPDAPIVAYVSDVASGRVTVMRGDDEVTLTDRDLARRIAGAVS